MRGSRDFGSLAGYGQFLKDLFAQRMRGRRVRLAEEMAVDGGVAGAADGIGQNGSG